MHLSYFNAGKALELEWHFLVEKFNEQNLKLTLFA
jgi:hypothetical protein